ncbi:MAG: HAMP domain-containing histidine kinase [Spirochaetales bacterium]|nr:MAG: HAMP domain-containing histidine kinase [Spirochaetales bacterium]
MSLRLKFMFLIIGVLIIPYLAIVLIVSINFYVSGSQVSVRSLMQGAEFVEKAVKQDIDKDRIEENLPSLEGSWTISVADESGAILFPAAGSAAGGEDFRNSIITVPDGGARNIQVLPIRFTDGTSGSLLFIRTMRGFPGRINKYLNLLLPFCLFLFTTAMSFLILRSINRSLSALESATRRIAEGDLSFELKPRGRDQIASLVHSFNAMKEKLKEEYARRSRFMMSISHDLKSPLASIEGYTAAIRDGYAETPEKLDQYLSIIEQKTGLLNSRISSLINFINKETDGWRAELRAVPLQSFLEEYDRIFQGEAGLNNLVYESSLSLPGDLNVNMDEDLVLRAFDNIGQNAIRYSRPGGNVGFFAEWKGANVEVRFENEGEAIKEKDLPSLFEPFYRGDQARNTPGSGLGLSIVKSVLHSHGWDIGASSTPEGRTVFTVIIPLSTPLS